MARLGDIATYINGCAFKPSDWSEDGLEIIRIQNLTGNAYEVNRYNGDYNPKYEINNGDVLISWSASLGVYIWQRGKALLNQHIFKVVFDKVEVDKHYFVHQVSMLLAKYASIAHGSTMKHLTKPVFDNLPFDLPPLPEQQYIAAVLDKISSVIEMRRRQLEKFDELVKSRFVEMFENDSKYDQKSVREICSIITDGTHQPPIFVSDGIPFLFVSNVVTNAITYNTDKYISQETYDNLIKRTPIEVGDVLLSTVGSYGHPAVVRDERKFLFQRHIAYLKPKHNLINSDYLHASILSDKVQRQIEQKVKGIAQKTLNLSEIKDLRLTIPPLHLQQKFADFVSHVDRSKFAARASLEKMTTLKAALMQRYFSE